MTEADTGTLLGLFCQDRAPVLLRMQFNARQQEQSAAYPDAVDHLLMLDGTPVGRLVIATLDRRGESELRLVDLVVDRRYRRRGLGAAALQPWIEQARARLLPVTTLIAPESPTRAFFTRLGFRPDVAAGGNEVALPLRLDVTH